MKTLYWISLITIGGFIIFLSSYKVYTSLDPDLTCAQCHEINTACKLWRNSSHANINCIECHGGAFSDGLHGFTEKAEMVYSHFTKEQTFEDISLKEKQVLYITSRCATCHQAEHVAWESGAHSTTYKDIFMDKEHNKTEMPYWDCFRCHGMHYDGNIYDLMSLEGSFENWSIKDKNQAERPAITCLSCHQIHAEQVQSIPYKLKSKDERDSLMKKTKNVATALYIRSDKRHIQAIDLYQTTILDHDSLVKVSNDPNTWLCMQCHAPNNRREAGSSDDKTPIGIYEGMSCLECHNPHSNQLKQNYPNVHKKH